MICMMYRRSILLTPTPIKNVSLKHFTVKLVCLFIISYEFKISLLVSQIGYFAIIISTHFISWSKIVWFCSNLFFSAELNKESNTPPLRIWQFTSWFPLPFSFLPPCLGKCFSILFWKLLWSSTIKPNWLPWIVPRRCIVSHNCTQ